MQFSDTAAERLGRSHTGWVRSTQSIVTLWHSNSEHGSQHGHSLHARQAAVISWRMKTRQQRGTWLKQTESCGRINLFTAVAPWATGVYRPMAMTTHSQCHLLQLPLCTCRLDDIKCYMNSLYRRPIYDTL